MTTAVDLRYRPVDKQTACQRRLYLLTLAWHKAGQRKLDWPIGRALEHGCTDDQITEILRLVDLPDGVVTIREALDRWYPIGVKAKWRAWWARLAS